MTYPAGDWAEIPSEAFHVSSSFLVMSILEWKENILQNSYVSFMKLTWMSAFYSTQRYQKKHLSSLNNFLWYSSILCVSKRVDYLNVCYSRTFFFYCSGFCHTLKWISHGFTCVLHPDPPSHLPLHPIPLGLPSAPGPSACLMHPTWAGDLFHPR